jgi:hypothetical protein
MVQLGTFSVGTAAVIVLSAIAASVLVGSVVFGDAGRRSGAAVSAGRHGSPSPAASNAPVPSAGSAPGDPKPETEMEYPLDTD